MNNHHVSSKPVTILQAFQISLVRNLLLLSFFMYIIWLHPEISVAFYMDHFPPPPQPKKKKKKQEERKIWVEIIFLFVDG